MNKKFGLIILDGWGLGDHGPSDAIFQANTPFMDSLLANYPNATLRTFGEDVGLPDGQIGNSEVGHLNIGAGRIVYQELTRINKSIRDGEFQQNPTILEAFKYAKTNHKKVHFIGISSPFSSFCAQKLINEGVQVTASELSQGNDNAKFWLDQKILYPQCFYSPYLLLRYPPSKFSVYNHTPQSTYHSLT
jgi:bisphosphoglycerate-independent phosphoglycerate mutase (AlkP superfamily)